MSKIAYFLTGIAKAARYGPNDTIFDYDSLGSRMAAIGAIGGSSDKLVGKLELPDEHGLGSQTSIDHLVQVGYMPGASDDIIMPLKMRLRGNGLKRVSVVSWEDMPEDDGNKPYLVKQIIRAGEEIVTYLEDNQKNIANLFERGSDRQEAYDLMNRAAKYLNDFDLARKSHGLTKEQSLRLFYGEMKIMAYSGLVYGMDAARLMAMAENATLPESRSTFREEGIRLAEKSMLIKEQLKARHMEMLIGDGAGSDNIAVVRLGSDEFRMMENGAGLREIIEMQGVSSEGYDGPDRPGIGNLLELSGRGGGLPEGLGLGGLGGPRGMDNEMFAAMMQVPELRAMADDIIDKLVPEPRMRQMFKEMLSNPELLGLLDE
ncbi:MAG: hypothetical protein ABIJ08_01355 [Nanoarchaeota archaeon]